MGALEVWGLDETAEAVYRFALRHPGSDAADVCQRLRLTDDTVAQALRQLVELTLVTDAPTGLQAAPPTTVLASLVQNEIRTLDDRRARLDGVRAGLAAFSVDFLAGQTRSWSTVPFEVLAEQDAIQTFEDLQRGSEGEILTCHAVDEIEAVPQSFYELVREQLRAGRAMRAVYPASIVDDPGKLAYVRSWAAAGEQVRLLPAPVREIGVYGDQAALISSRWEGQAGSMIVIRAPAMIAILRELFERYWERAIPIGRVGSSDGDDLQSRMLELLMMGAKDETIARHLGVSLRTVRRRISEFMDEMGATTRFQAGLEAGRRGLV